MNKHSLPLCLAVAFALTAATPSAAEEEHEVGFVEEFALAEDRGKALEQLVPGTDGYYFYHALHYQNLGKLEHRATATSNPSFLRQSSKPENRPAKGAGASLWAGCTSDGTLRGR